MSHFPVVFRGTRASTFRPLSTHSNEITNAHTADPAKEGPKFSPLYTARCVFPRKGAIALTNDVCLFTYFQSRLEELEEELEQERANRAKAEKTRQVLSRELEDLGEKLEESGNATATQMELNRKRESELAKLKEDYDTGALQHETALAGLRQKHNSVIADLGEQIDQLNKAKSK